MKGLYRCHHAASEILQYLSRGENAQAEGHVVQLLKALHQMALDRGAWTHAIHLIPTADPFGRANFGDTELEMQQVH